MSLFDSRFQKELLKRAPCVEIQTRSRRDWYRELSKLRDPIAHRIPIFAVPTVLTPAERQKQQQTFTAAKIALKRGDFNEATRLFEKMDTVGSYVPIFSHCFGRSRSIRPVWPQVRLDVTHLCEIAEPIFNALGPLSCSRGREHA